MTTHGRKSDKTQSPLASKVLAQYIHNYASRSRRRHVGNSLIRPWQQAQLRKSVSNDAPFQFVDDSSNDTCSTHLERGKFATSGVPNARYLSDK